MTSSRTCTRVVALIAAYAIVLHGLLLAFFPLPLGAAASAHNGSGIDLCVHHLAAGGVTPQSPGAPAGSDIHCTFCIAQCHSVALAPDREAQVILRPASEPLWFVQRQFVPAFPRYRHKQPRGPPAGA